MQKNSRNILIISLSADRKDQKKHNWKQTLKRILYLQRKPCDVWGDIAKIGKNSQLIVIQSTEIKFKQKWKSCISQIAIHNWDFKQIYSDVPYKLWAEVYISHFSSWQNKSYKQRVYFQK